MRSATTSCSVGSSTAIKLVDNARSTTNCGPLGCGLSIPHSSRCRPVAGGAAGPNQGRTRPGSHPNAFPHLCVGAHEPTPRTIPGNYFQQMNAKLRLRKRSAMLCSKPISLPAKLRTHGCWRKTASAASTHVYGTFFLPVARHASCYKPSLLHQIKPNQTSETKNTYWGAKTSQGFGSVSWVT